MDFRFDHGTGAKTTGTDRDLFHLSGIQLGPDVLEIGFETALALVVGVTDVVAHQWFFSANITTRGHRVPPEILYADSWHTLRF